MVVTLEEVKKNKKIQAFITAGDNNLKAMGFTDHSYRHVSLIATNASLILEKLGYPERQCQLAAIAGYMHDIGNVVSRHDHGQSGAMLAYDLLTEMNMDPEEITEVIAAIGNHEEQYGHAVNPLAAALILADKADVHRSRVRNRDVSTFDIHDRVNYGAEKASLEIDPTEKTITMELKIDLEITTVMEYFEIFLDRMIMCRRAATFLGCSFGLIINEAKLL
ncbi:MAG: HD domain-containing protein [Bacillota bacterium]|nr:HD domain-containing protein [Bacillota bacterium]